MDELPNSVERGIQEIEDNPFVVENEDGRLGGLADLDGVGPSAVRNSKMPEYRSRAIFMDSHRSR